MNELSKKSINAVRRSARTRSHIHGTASKPRLSVHISNKHISAQLIDDDAMKTLASVSSVTSTDKTGSLTEKAARIGTEIAKKAKTSKVSEVVFDRGAKKYHGRIKALADAAREEGLKF